MTNKEYEEPRLDLFIVSEDVVLASGKEQWEDYDLFDPEWITP